MTEYTVLLVFESPRLDRFLLARHRTRGWELPGGRVEAGEDVVAAARREWDEETGLPLAHLMPLLLHHRDGGDRGHVFLGAVHEALDRPVTPAVRLHDPDEKIEEVRPVRALAELSPLAFPDDPYPELAEAVWRQADDGPWRRRLDEERAAFLRRLAEHPDRIGRTHVVEPHPRALELDDRVDPKVRQ